MMKKETTVTQMSPHDLLKINVNEHTEKKNGLTYLSWAWAWQEALKADQTATFDVQTFDGKPYMDVNGTGMVWVTVTLFGQPRTCMLPVMDYKTKALALHGLGIYIYAGDDLPQSDAPTTMGELTKQEDAPKYEKIIAKTAPKADETLDNSDASRQLFADGMIEYTSHCTTVAGLNSYWKSNQLQLDSLKVTHPDLYQGVLTKFQELKKSFSNGETK
jgi:hypothetical protein